MQLDFLILLAGILFVFTVVQRRPEFRKELRVAFYAFVALLMFDRMDERVPPPRQPTAFELALNSPAVYHATTALLKERENERRNDFE
jgi:hypothetical protein